MPVTPFHYPIAKLIHGIDGQERLSLPALIVGSTVPDLEVPFVWLLTGSQDRLVLHSLIGGLTLGTVIAVAISALLYAPIVSVVLPVNKVKLKEKCRLSGVLVLSCLIGVLSHVLLDIANHQYNPILWPFLSAYQTPSPIVPLLGGGMMASLIVHGSLILVFAGLCLASRDNFWDQLFVE